MTLGQIKERLQSGEYDFLRTDEHLGHHIILLTLGGSHAYGTSMETSDLDIRGCALNSKREILIHEDFGQITDPHTDTTIYAFRKLIPLLTNCNPNTIEMLGGREDHYLHIAPVGRELLDHAHLFLSQRAVYSFGGYANQQLRRLDNKAARLVEQTDNERHILKTIEHASFDWKNRYFYMPGDSVNLYIGKALKEEYDSEIFMDITLRHYPLRDYKCLWSEMQSIVKSYEKVGKRNQNAIEHGKLGKHMMHLIRLYMMCLDILEKEQIVTYREKEHDLLMDIRNGRYLDENQLPVPEFFEMVDEYEKRLDYARKNTSLPEEPDIRKINDFVASVNERVVKGELSSLYTNIRGLHYKGIGIKRMGVYTRPEPGNGQLAAYPVYCGSRIKDHVRISTE